MKPVSPKDWAKAPIFDRKSASDEQFETFLTMVQLQTMEACIHALEDSGDEECEQAGDWLRAKTQLEHWLDPPAEFAAEAK